MEKRTKILQSGNGDSISNEPLNEKARALQKQDEYSQLRNEREKATFAMTMKMNPEALTNIRKEFFARKDVVSLDEFMYIIQKHLVARGGDDKFVMETKEQREFGTSMYELFKDIDVNGDKLLEWQVMSADFLSKISSNRKIHLNIRNSHPLQWRKQTYSINEQN